MGKRTSNLTENTQKHVERYGGRNLTNSIENKEVYMRDMSVDHGKAGREK